MREVWIVSNAPPPVHGVSAFNAALRVRLDERGVPQRLFRVGTRGAFTGVERMSGPKLVRDAGALAALTLACAREPAARSVIYFTPSQGGMAVLRDAAVARIARASRRRLVAHIHGCAWLTTWERGGWQARLMLDSLRACARIICLGETYARRMADATGLPCVGVNNGVVAPAITQTRAAPRPGECIELLYLSNFVRSKGLWTAAQGLRELRARHLPARLRCAGAWLREEDRAEFLREFEREIADGTLEVIGFASGEVKRRLFSESHFFILPTELAEGQPLSLIEAMASGLVPVTTRQGGIEDLFGFDDWEDLANSDHRNPAAVATTIATLAHHRQRYERLSSRCIDRYRQELTMDRCADVILGILQAA